MHSTNVIVIIALHPQCLNCFPPYSLPRITRPKSITNGIGTIQQEERYTQATTQWNNTERKTKYLVKLLVIFHLLFKSLDLVSIIFFNDASFICDSIDNWTEFFIAALCLTKTILMAMSFVLKFLLQSAHLLCKLRVFLQQSCSQNVMQSKVR